MWRWLVALVSVVAMAGCGSSTEDEPASKPAKKAAKKTAAIRGCAPQCLPPNITEPGAVPKGTYKTVYFFAGQMKLTFEDGWTIDEDSTGELSAAEAKHPDLRVIFWEDIFPTRFKEGTRQLAGVPVTADGVVGWLRNNRNLVVTAPRQGSIGSGLPASVVDVSVSRKAKNDDPECPAKPCANFLGYPQWGEPYGIAGRGVTRFWFSDVKYGGNSHLFVAAVEGVDKAQLDAGLPGGEKVIKSARVPAAPA